MTAFEHQTILEERINDLTRLNRAIRIMAEQVFGDLRIHADNNRQVAGVMSTIEADQEVLEAMIDDADCQARDLRVTFYEKPSQAA